MSRLSSMVLMGLSGTVWLQWGCSQSNLDAITRTSLAAGAPNTGGTSTGGVATGGITTGGNTGDVGTGGLGTGGGTGGTSASACGSATLTPGDTNETVQVGSVTRSYFLHVPSTYLGTKPVPLIIDYHYLGNSGLQEQHVSPFPDATASDGVVVVFPNGDSGPGGSAWNIGPCCVTQNTDDLAFTRALVDQLKRRACVDVNRIYAVGYQIGGGMAHYVGCHAADLFAAIAPVGFDLLKETVTDCQPTRPLTVVLFRELSDTFVPYSGGTWSMVSGMPVTLLGAQTTFTKWAEINECNGTPTAEDSNGCTSYASCKGGVEVVLCTRQAGVPVPDNGSIAWPILQRHRLP